jgi:hypothetical protein
MLSDSMRVAGFIVVAMSACLCRERELPHSQGRYSRLAKMKRTQNYSLRNRAGVSGCTQARDVQAGSAASILRISSTTDSFAASAGSSRPRRFELSLLVCGAR